jgi:hypothetical protein
VQRVAVTGAFNPITAVNSLRLIHRLCWFRRRNEITQRSKWLFLYTWVAHIFEGYGGEANENSRNQIKADNGMGYHFVIARIDLHVSSKLFIFQLLLTV